MNRFDFDVFYVGPDRCAHPKKHAANEERSAFHKEECWRDDARLKKFVETLWCLFRILGRVSSSAVVRYVEDLGTPFSLYVTEQVLRKLCLYVVNLWLENASPRRFFQFSKKNWCVLAISPQKFGYNFMRPKS